MSNNRDPSKDKEEEDDDCSEEVDATHTETQPAFEDEELGPNDFGIRDDDDHDDHHHDNGKGRGFSSGIIREIAPSSSSSSPRRAAAAASSSNVKKCLILACIAIAVAGVVAVALAIVLPSSPDNSRDNDAYNNKNNGSTWSPYKAVGPVLTNAIDGLASSSASSSSEWVHDFDASHDGRILVVAGVEAPDYTLHVRLYTWNVTTWIHAVTMPLGDADPATLPTVRLAKGIDNETPLLVIADAQAVDTLATSKSTNTSSSTAEFDGLVRFYEIQQHSDNNQVELVHLEEISSPYQWGSAISVSDDGSRVAIGQAMASVTQSVGQGTSMRLELAGAVHVQDITVQNKDVDGIDDHERGAEISPVGATQFGQAAYDSMGGSGIALSGDGLHLAAGIPLHSSTGKVAAGQVRIWDWNHPESPNEWTEEDAGLNQIVGGTGQGLGEQVLLSYNGNIMATTTLVSKQVLVYNLVDQDGDDVKVWLPMGENSPLQSLTDVTAMDMTSNGRRIATVSQDNTVRIFDYDQTTEQWQAVVEENENTVLLKGTRVRLLENQNRILVHFDDDPFNGDSIQLWEWSA